MDSGSRSRTSMIIVVSGVVLSSGLGIFFYFRTDLSTALATFAGLIGTTITLQVEALLREKQTHELVTRQQRLMARVEATPWMPELLDRTLGSYSLIEEGYGSTLALELARSTFVNCQEQMEALSRGRYSTSELEGSSSPNAPSYRLIESVRTSMLATSTRDDLRWWIESPGSRSWWKLNLDALKRGVLIKRIFIYRDWSDELDSLARVQEQAGVMVLRAKEADLPAALRLNVVVWDASCVEEPEYNMSGEWTKNNYVFAAQAVSLAVERFKMIESLAEPVPGLPAS